MSQHSIWGISRPVNSIIGDIDMSQAIKSQAPGSKTRRTSLARSATAWKRKTPLVWTGDDGNENPMGLRTFASSDVEGQCFRTADMSWKQSMTPLRLHHADGPPQQLRRLSLSLESPDLASQDTPRGVVQFETVPGSA